SKRGIAQALWEVRRGGVHGDLESLVINNLKARELVNAFFGITLNCIEEVSAQLCVCYSVVPGINEHFGGYVTAVGGLPVIPLGGELGGNIIRLNGFRKYVWSL